MDLHVSIVQDPWIREQVVVQVMPWGLGPQEPYEIHGLFERSKPDSIQVSHEFAYWADWIHHMQDQKTNKVILVTNKVSIDASDAKRLETLLQNGCLEIHIIGIGSAMPIWLLRPVVSQKGSVQWTRGLDVNVLQKAIQSAMTPKATLTSLKIFKDDQLVAESRHSPGGFTLFQNQASFIVCHDSYFFAKEQDFASLIATDRLRVEARIHDAPFKTYISTVHPDHDIVTLEKVYQDTKNFLRNYRKPSSEFCEACIHGLGNLEAHEGGCSEDRYQADFVTDLMNTLQKHPDYKRPFGLASLCVSQIRLATSLWKEPIQDENTDLEELVFWGRRPLVGSLFLW